MVGNEDVDKLFEWIFKFLFDQGLLIHLFWIIIKSFFKLGDRNRFFGYRCNLPSFERSDRYEVSYWSWIFLWVCSLDLWTYHRIHPLFLTGRQKFLHRFSLRRPYNIKERTSRRIGWTSSQSQRSDECFFGSWAGWRKTLFVWTLCTYWLLWWNLHKMHKYLQNHHFYPEQLWACSR